jgi:hypothetical protein
MNSVDYEWVKEQLTKARTRKGSGDAAIELLKTWEAIDISEELQSEAVKVFASLAQGYALVAEGSKEEVWVPAQAGNMKVADQVRVKTDAFSGSLGKMHNGRRGVIIAIRYGDIIINSTDNHKHKLSGAHYAPHHLEKLIK